MTCNDRVSVDPGTPLGGRGGAGRRPGPRRLCRSRPRRRDAVGGAGRMGGRCGSNRSPPSSPRDAILVEEERILSWALDAHTDQPAPSPTVETDGWTCCKPTPPPRSPATTGWSWSSGRPERARRRCWPAPLTISSGRPGGVRGGSDGQGGPGAGTRDRHGDGHGRQAAPRMEPPRPATVTATASVGDDSDRR